MLAFIARRLLAFIARRLLAFIARRELAFIARRLLAFIARRELAFIAMQQGCPLIGPKKCVFFVSYKDPRDSPLRNPCRLPIAHKSRPGKP